MKNTDTNLPEVCLLELAGMGEIRTMLQSGDQRFAAAFNQLCDTADKLLQAIPYSVMDKTAVPPSGDKHDYMSLGSYWWPNPDTTDGRPYVRRDGEYNPEGHELDVDRVKKLCRECSTLAYAFFFTANAKYSRKCEELLKTWFVNPETRMNPHLNFGQAIPGICEGRGIGVIDTRGFTFLLDAVGILRTAGGISAQTLGAITEWMEQYLDWLVESPIGIDEAGQKNNHGTWYDVQAVRLAVFTGRKELAATICAEAKNKRIAVQIGPGGSQPMELARTRSRDYSAFNTSGLLDLAALASAVSVDLLNYATPDGRSIRSAIEWLIPYVTGEKNWNWRQITDFEVAGYFEIFRRAAIYYQDLKYEKVLDSFNPQDVMKHEIQLIHPLTVDGNLDLN